MSLVIVWFSGLVTVLGLLIFMGYSALQKDFIFANVLFWILAFIVLMIGILSGLPLRTKSRKVREIKDYGHFIRTL